MGSSNNAIVWFSGLFFGCNAPQKEHSSPSFYVENPQWKTTAGLLAQAKAAEWSPGDAGHGTALDIQVVASQKPHLEIVSKASSWDLEKKEVVFWGEVMVTRDSLKISTEKLQVQFLSASELTTATASQGVQLEDGDRTATAGRMEIDIPAGKMTLKESPIFRTSSGMFSGGVITLWLDKKQILCEEGCRLILEKPSSDLTK